MPQAAADDLVFWAASLMATHSNGISALQLQHQLGLGGATTTVPVAPA
jgi:hypothetical protein